MSWLELLLLLHYSCQTLQNLVSSDEINIPTLHLDSLQLTLTSRLLLDVFSLRGASFKGYLGWLSQDSNLTYSICARSSNSICVKYHEEMILQITEDDRCDHDRICYTAMCHKIMWKNHMEGAKDCFVLGEEHWYGGGMSKSQRWPLQGSQSWHPSATGDPLHHPIGGLVENMWFNSAGFAIRVENKVPLLVSFNESGNGLLCFSTSNETHPYQGLQRKSHLSYTICSADSPKDVYSLSSHKWLKKPLGTPKESILRFPIWSTWARYKSVIDSELVEKFASEIIHARFPASQLEIDDMWENCYGNLEFNSTRFPDPRAMVERLEKVGFPVTLWVHPFCNTECDLYEDGSRLGYWVKNISGDILRVTWWNGEASVLDTTNKAATEWFVERLESLRNRYGISSFKFDAGELMWLESYFSFQDNKANREPNLFSKFYAEAASLLGNRIEVRVGYDTQDLPILVRMFDKFSNWNDTNGLTTLIPSALQMSSMGYFFILPDMIGGNNYEASSGSLPDRELYVRWLQVCTFMPSIQFSITPWDYDEEVVIISRHMLELRNKHSEYIVSLARQAMLTGEPIIRPLWWISPDDEECLTNDSEFMLGDEILVAPVLEKGKTSRDIYLPDGIWTDVQRGKTYFGLQWLYDYKAPLKYLPYFILKY